METVQSYYGLISPDRVAGRKLKRSRKIGIEIELEQVYAKARTSWKKQIDGSLKLNGMEYTLCLWHTSARTILNTFFSKLEYTNSDRTSIHVHVNIEDFTIDQIRSLLLLYIIFEKPLYKFSGNRWNNIHCVPLQTTILTPSIELMRFGKLPTRKYSGIYLVPSGQYATVEFRQMKGQDNVNTIVSWINIIVNLVKYAETSNYEELKNRISFMRVNSAYHNLAQEVFGKHYGNLCLYESFAKDVEEGILIAKLSI